MRNLLLLGCTMAAFSAPSFGAVKTESVPYTVDDKEFEGYLAYDDATAEKRPLILIVHEWWGLNNYPKSVAKRLAESGYVAFAVDMYGEDKTTGDPKQAGAWSSEVRNDPALARRRFEAALKLAKADPHVDTSKVAAIGYCFGGTVVLEMARMGVDLNAVVSFHGGLSSKVPPEEKHLKASVLVNHGAADPMESPEELAAFKEEMTALNADWELNIYAKAEHAFSNPAADSYGIKGVSYNKLAAERSWGAMKVFLDSVFNR